MKLIRADRQLEGTLQEFHSQFPHRAITKIQAERTQGFFSTYQLLSDEYATYALVDEQEKIQGCASFVIREVLLQGKRIKVAFGRDLQIARNRKAIMGWTDHFLPVMEEVSTQFQAEYFFSAIPANDVKTYNSLIRPRPSDRKRPRYFLFQKFNLMTIHGRLPGSPRPLSTVSCHQGVEADFDEIAFYINTRAKSRPLATSINSDTLRDRLDRWPGFSMRDFLYLRDGQGNIRACAALWSPRSCLDLRVKSYGARGENLRGFLRLASWVGMGHPLPPAGESLKPLFLTHLHADNEDLFETLVWHAFQKIQKEEFLAYIQFEKDRTLASPRAWITTRSPYGLYLLLPPGHVVPPFLHPALAGIPELEMISIF